MAEGCGDLSALAHIFPPVQPSDKVTGQLDSLFLPEGGEATGRPHINSLPNQRGQ